jgi:thioredoxin-related protein
MKRIIFSILFLLAAGIAVAQTGEQPYNPDQNIRADLKNAIEQAKKENKQILIQFGGNWCPWCLRFHALVKGVPRVDSLMKENYIYLLLNVPREKEKRDMTLFRDFNFPNRFGYPVFVILNQEGNQIHTQDSDAFEYQSKEVKGYDTTKVVRFLSLWTTRALDPESYQKK